MTHRERGEGPTRVLQGLPYRACPVFIRTRQKHDIDEGLQGTEQLQILNTIIRAGTAAQ
jgi:hypothetical protein